MTEETTDKSALGEVVIYRSMFHKAITLMETDRLEAIHAGIPGTVGDLKERWGSDLSRFQVGIIDAYESVLFTLGQQLEISRGERARPKDELHFTCRDCGMVFLPNLNSSGCINCGSTAIEVDRVQPPED